MNIRLICKKYICKIEKIYNMPLLVKIRNLLLYNTLRIFILVVCLLLIIFYCSPKNAHVIYSASQVSEISDIDFDNAKISLCTNMFSIHDFEKIVIEVSNIDNIEIDNEKYTCNDCNNEYRFVVTSGSESLDGYVNFFNANKGAGDYLNCYISSNFERYNDFDKSPFYIKSIDTDGFQITSQISFNISTDSSLDVFFDDCNISLECDNKLIKSFSNSRVTINKANNDYSDLNFSVQGLSNLDIVQINDRISSQAQIKLENIKTISCVSSGNLNFKYTLNPSIYETNEQSLSLESKHRELDAIIEFDKQLRNIKMLGMVSNAYLSNLNLFPSFAGWYRENVYLAPLTLATTVLGAVSLTNKNKK